jgi:hypothetical protein
MFGARCGLPPAHTLNFGEEVVRDQPLFVAALLAAELEPRLRTAAGCSPWQVRRWLVALAAVGGLGVVIGGRLEEGQRETELFRTTQSSDPDELPTANECRS